LGGYAAKADRKSDKSGSSRKFGEKSHKEPPFAETVNIVNLI
jgi:hypothetical protein